MPKGQHVVPRNGGWAVRREGSDRITSQHDTQSEAYDAAREIARNQRTELYLHGRNGQIRARESFGNDPCPPKDQEH